MLARRGGWAARLARACLLAMLLLNALGPVLAHAEPIDDEVRRIARQLRCPICESVSVADSPSELAAQMRAVIRKKLEAGESEQAILDYFVQAYGDSVLLEPPRRGLGWAIWLGPLVALMVGAGLLAWLLRIWLRPRETANGLAPEMDDLAGLDVVSASADELEAQARRELEAVRKGLVR